MYIPTPHERNQLWKKISKESQNQEKPYQKQESNDKQITNESKKLSSNELAELLNRLTTNTKKHHHIQQQIAQIRQSNQKINQKRKKDEKVQERLIEHGKKYEKDKQEKIQQRKNEIKEKYYRQTPQISQKAKNVIQIPLSQRLNKVLESRQITKNELIRKYTPSFHPSVDSFSNFINDIENYGDAANRMKQKQKQASERRSKLEKNLQKQRLKDCTHHPQIDDKSRILAKHKPNIINRQSNRTRSVEDSFQQCSFVPKINKNTSMLLKDYPKGSRQQIFNRLYNISSVYEMNRKQKQKQSDKDLTYQPQINRRSASMMKSRQKKEDEDIQEIFVTSRKRTNTSKLL